MHIDKVRDGRLVRMCILAKINSSHLRHFVDLTVVRTYLKARRQREHVVQLFHCLFGSPKELDEACCIVWDSPGALPG